MNNDYGSYINNSNYDARDSSQLPHADGSSALSSPPAAASPSCVANGPRITSGPGMDLFAWVDQCAPTWNPKQIYKPGDQVNFGGNVYRVPNGGGFHSGVTPGASDSKWLYHGTVENNYSYYRKGAPDPAMPGVSRPDDSSALASPVNGLIAGSDASIKEGKYTVLHDLQTVFNGAFKNVGNYLGRVGAEGSRVYEGSDFNGRFFNHGLYFKGYEATLKPGERPLQEGGYAQVFYLRPEDKLHPENIDPMNYVISTDVDFSTVNKEVVNVETTTIEPKEWSGKEKLDHVPDYGYLHVPVYDMGDLDGLGVAKPYNFPIQDSSGREYLSRYEG
jgi:hypothetical protein